MKQFFLAATLAIAGLFAALSAPASAAQFSSAATATKSTLVAPAGSINNNMIVKVRKWRRFRGRRGRRWGFRRWKRHNHYGSLVGGIVLGTILAAAATNIYQPPRDDLCWYWANRRRTRGYWDYC